MKIRIKGDSIRLRLSQRSCRNRGQEQCVENTHFSDSVLGYVLESHTDQRMLRHIYRTVRFGYPINDIVANTWANSDQVGLRPLKKYKPSILIEKDFPMLDR